MSYPFCYRCRHEVLPGVGCRCAELQADYDAAVAEQRRERQAERDYWEQVEAQLAAEQAGRDADVVADGLYEAQRARARDDAQTKRDFERGDR